MDVRSSPSAVADDDFNDYAFWRVPPPAPSEVGLPEIQTTQATPDATYNDIHFWRVPVPDPSELGVNCPASPAFPGDSRGDRAANPPEFSIASMSAPLDSEDEELIEAEDDSDAADDDQTLGNLMQGAAGNRLLGLLGRLSQHLGPESRFARAAGQLQNDFERARQDASSDATTLPVDSTLRAPEVRTSVGSLLSLLNEGGGPTAMEVDGDDADGARVRPPMLLFDVAEAAMSPPSPASPQAIAALSPPCAAFALDGKNNCAICLEVIECADDALSMPCANPVQHVFHKPCLLQWLDTRNSCPICRHLLPTEVPQADEQESSQEGQANEQDGQAESQVDAPEE